MDCPSISEQARRHNLAINMAAYRQVECLTITQAARFARLPTGTWRKLEAGEISASQQTLERVAEALDTTPEALLRPPLQGSVRATAFCLAGFTLDEIFEVVAEPYLERQRILAKAAGHTLESLVETAEALDKHPLDVLDELLRDRPPPSRTIH